MTGLPSASSLGHVAQLEPDTTGDHFDELVMELKKVVIEVRQHLLDAVPDSEPVRLGVVLLLVFVPFEEPG